MTECPCVTPMPCNYVRFIPPLHPLPRLLFHSSSFFHSFLLLFLSFILSPLSFIHSFSSFFHSFFFTIFLFHLSSSSFSSSSFLFQYFFSDFVFFCIFFKNLLFSFDKNNYNPWNLSGILKAPKSNFQTRT